MLDISSVFVILSNMNRFGDYLKAIRKEKGYTLRRAEELSGISNAYLSQLENGKIKNPSLSVIHKLSKAYETPYSTLMKFAGFPSQDNLIDDQSFDSQVGPVTEEEAKELIDYLHFIRSRRNK
ncbi:helix-turn-helix transcriptional regulator [Candidatus Dojkabacteria bacterium]|nr:helix-turn-helix transcriptional regulator [Candidatus Dojkabacteria bacterium]